MNPAALKAVTVTGMVVVLAGSAIGFSVTLGAGDEGGTSGALSTAGSSSSTTGTRSSGGRARPSGDSSTTSSSSGPSSTASSRASSGSDGRRRGGVEVQPETTDTAEVLPGLTDSAPAGPLVSASPEKTVLAIIGWSRTSRTRSARRHGGRSSAAASPRR